MLVPKEWDAILRRVQRGGFPEAVIAGGALRDLDNGREVKDLDIFVSAKADMKTKLDAVFGFTGKVVVDELAVDYVGNLADVAAIYDYNEADHLGSLLTETFYPLLVPSNIIAVNGDVTIKWMVERIDLGLCRVGYDGASYLFGAGYAADRKNGTMTVMRCESAGQLWRTYQRFKRLEQKYSGFEMIIPAEFAHFLEEGEDFETSKIDFTNVRCAA